MNPKVSICLPNLNNQPFIVERLDGILAQTFQDWELVVVDSYSDDGAWEIIQAYAAKESRMRIYQAPRNGIYTGINECIELAKGEYIYIATSDDTMMPDCLEKMVSALDRHPECGLAHCCLEVIDERGQTIENNNWTNWAQCQFFGDYISQEHIRYAPHDGILYCSLGTVYVSLTQLLIRSTVFETVGCFKTNFSSMADFEWGLRASLVCNTVHVPHYLATWRRHSVQATQESYLFSAEGQEELCQMIYSAIETLKSKNHNIAFELNKSRLSYYTELQQLKFGLSRKNTFLSRIKYLLKFALTRWQVLYAYIYFRLTKKEINRVERANNLLTKLDVKNKLKLVRHRQNVA